MWTDLSTVLSQYTCVTERQTDRQRQTDRRTDRILIARPRLHSMQRGKKQEISQQVVIRMQDLASEFSKKNSGGDTPGPSQREGTPSAPNTQPGAQTPRCWDPTLVPLNFSAVAASLFWEVGWII